mmetsp:Transcript_5519/g.10840  ORF Transcript_5519/g.10840 Transcript_5519/m.10840 type:complete len:238 (-) Transcript_5519:1614-2327(-)
MAAFSSRCGGAVLLMRGISLCIKPGMYLPIGAPTCRAISPKAQLELLHTEICVGLMFAAAIGTNLSRCGLMCPMHARARSPRSAKALCRTSASWSFAHSNRSIRHWLLPIKDSMAPPNPSASPLNRSREHTMNSLSASAPMWPWRARCCSRRVLRMILRERLKTGWANGRNPVRRACATLVRHSRRGKMPRSLSLTSFHRLMSGGMRILMSSLRFSAGPTASARVPMASYSTSMFLA